MKHFHFSIRALEKMKSRKLATLENTHSGVLLYERMNKPILCSTSPPGGNQVDGLPPAPNTPERVFYQRGEFTAFRFFECADVKLKGVHALTFLC